MKHDDFRERIELMMYEELGAEEVSATEAHLSECADCRAFREELTKLHGVLSKYSPAGTTDLLLQEARDQLRSAIRAENMKKSLWESVRGFIEDMIIPQYKIAAGAAFTLACGFLLGYFAFTSAPVESPAFQVPAQTVRQSPVLEKEEGQITNVRNIKSDPASGEVEFMFDAVMPVRMKGSVNDPKIQQVLAHALLNDQNPGVRLRTVSAIASERTERPDSEVRDILITAATTDVNPGVRMEALKALQQFPLDAKLKKTFLDILTHDANSALRIAAINALASAPGASSPPDQEFLDVLKQRMQTDNNDYIRLRAKAVLQENKQ